MSRDLALVYLDAVETPQRGNLQNYMLGVAPRDVSGAHGLVQLVTMTLLTDGGSHTLDPGWGVGIGRVLRKGFGNLDDVRAAVIVAVAQAREQILTRQSGESMPDDERLEDLSVQAVIQDAIGVLVLLSVTTAAGASLVLNSRDFLR